MNKIELIEHVAKQADISKAAAGRALEAVVGGIRASLKKGNSVTLVGFGTFSIGKRAARAGRNPRTGETIPVPAKRLPFFKVGKELRERVNRGRQIAEAGAAPRPQPVDTPPSS